MSSHYPEMSGSAHEKLQNINQYPFPGGLRILNTSESTSCRDGLNLLLHTLYILFIHPCWCQGSKSKTIPTMCLPSTCSLSLEDHCFLYVNSFITTPLSYNSTSLYTMVWFFQVAGLQAMLWQWLPPERHPQQKLPRPSSLLPRRQRLWRLFKKL